MSQKTHQLWLAAVSTMTNSDWFW